MSFTKLGTLRMVTTLRFETFSLKWQINIIIIYEEKNQPAKSDFLKELKRGN